MYAFKQNVSGSSENRLLTQKHRETRHSYSNTALYSLEPNLFKIDIKIILH